MIFCYLHLLSSFKPRLILTRSLQNTYLNATNVKNNPRARSTRNYFSGCLTDIYKKMTSTMNNVSYDNPYLKLKDLEVCLFWIYGHEITHTHIHKHTVELCDNKTYLIY